jgi:flagellar assembly protein FliH
MTTPFTRRPRFLAGVPEAPAPEPARFASLSPRPALAAPPPAEPPPAAPLPVPDLAALRQDALERVEAAVATLRAQADRLAEQARGDAIEIGFQVARRILESELRQNPDALFALVRSALRRAGDSRRVNVRVAPEDLARLRSEEARGHLDGLTAARVEYVSDPALQPGDCVVDADFGQVDGRLTTRLAEVRRAVDQAGEGVA